MRHLEQPYRCIHERGNACYVVHRFNLAQILRPALKNRGNAPRVWYRVSRGFPSFPPPFFPLPRSIYTSLSIFNRLVVAYRFFRSTIPSSRSGKRKDNDFSLFFFFFFFTPIVVSCCREGAREKKIIGTSSRTRFHALVGR